MYPVPAKAETQGRTEIALGKWLKTVPRHNVIVATKVRERDRQARPDDGHQVSRVTPGMGWRVWCFVVAGTPLFLCTARHGDYPACGAGGRGSGRGGGGG